MQKITRKIQTGKVRSGIEIELQFQSFAEHLHAQPIFAEQVNKRDEKYGYGTCISVNDQVVHSAPEKHSFESGDLITVDAGIKIENICCDMARTAIYNQDEIKLPASTMNLICAVEFARQAAAKAIKPNATVGDISSAIEMVAEKHALSIITDFAGHSIGEQLHEPLRILNQPGIIERFDNIVLRSGMVLCVEPIFTDGGWDIIMDYDGWRVWTADGSLAVHEEDMILVTNDSSEILTSI